MIPKVPHPRQLLPLKVKDPHNLETPQSPYNPFLLFIIHIVKFALSMRLFSVTQDWSVFLSSVALPGLCKSFIFLWVSLIVSGFHCLDWNISRAVWLYVFSFIFPSTSHFGIQAKKGFWRFSALSSRRNLQWDFKIYSPPSIRVHKLMQRAGSYLNFLFVHPRSHCQAVVSFWGFEMLLLIKHWLQWSWLLVGRRRFEQT